MKKLIAIFLLMLWPVFIPAREGIRPDKIIKMRPDNDKCFFDYGGLFVDFDEYAQNYLKKNIRANYNIEAVIVTLPSLGGRYTIGQAANLIMNNWKIGRNDFSKGVLLLFIRDEKKARLEVSYELEDVFTDAFCGYAQDVQLPHYFTSDNIGSGLMAVMEEIEKRAAIKNRNQYTRDQIAALDREYLSGGAGAGRDLSNLKATKNTTAPSQYPAGSTPTEAFETVLKTWRDKIRDPDLEVYTEIYKLNLRYFVDLADAKFLEHLQRYDKPFQVIENGNYAVVHYGKKTGHENQPFLFCRTPEGWKFDYVHQAFLVRFGPNPRFGVIRTPSPYSRMLDRFDAYEDCDIWLDPESLYAVSQDRYLAQRIRDLEKKHQTNSDDYESMLELARLYQVTMLGRQKTAAMLKKCIALRPDDPRPYKNLALQLIRSGFEYKTALDYIQKYVQLKPKDVFGRNGLGFLYYMNKEYRKAIMEFEEALQIEPDNSYAFCYLSRSYALLYQTSLRINPLRDGYKAKALKMLEAATQVDTPDEQRILWLKHWLIKIKMTDKQ